jgi:alpha-L-fucosidase
MGVPKEDISLKSLGKNNNFRVKKIEMLGSSEKLFWQANPESLVIKKTNSYPNDIAVVFKIFLK